jgi:CRISPR-associated endonuclease/helicase Cas3
MHNYITALARPGQHLVQHLIGVGEMVSCYCSQLGSWARLLGVLHDYGKYRPAWVFGINEIAQGKDPGKLPPHAIEGAMYLMRLFPGGEHFKVRALGLLILSHHSSLPDISVGIDVLLGKDSLRPLPKLDDGLWDIDPEFKSEIRNTIEQINYATLDKWIIPGDFRAAQRLRFLYGSLVAADRQDAAMSDGWKPSQFPTIAELSDRLAIWYTKEFSDPVEELDKLRTDFYRECRKAAHHPSGWLSVRGPCGISKTWSVMQMALDHAVKWNKEKVFYCVPWTAILEQSYEQYQSVFGSDSVLGHWSTLRDPEDTHCPESLRKSRQWWDAPIVATTMVQLFDVLLGNSARTAQRMPSLQKSVIVLDEVQGLPIELLTTCLAVLDQLVQDHGATIILSTATMPEYSLLGIHPVEVLSQEKVEGYFDRTKRVDYHWRDLPLSWEDMALEIQESSSSSTLIVANTVAGCDDAYQTMADLSNYEIFKYTASMPPAHRSVVLAKIKAAVETAKYGGSPVIICATSAIETGVNLDCARGYRELAGLESVVQFAGRINRNNVERFSSVTIFKTTGTYSLPPGSDYRANRTLQAMAMGTDLQSPDVMKYYSRLLLQDAEDLQKNPKVYNYLAGLGRLEWETVSQKWQMVAPTKSVLIDPRLWGAAADVIDSYDQAIMDKNYRLLQQHCIGLYSGKHKEAKSAGCLSLNEFLGFDTWIGDYDMGIKVEKNLIW